jgi:hypothetical protein
LRICILTGHKFCKKISDEKKIALEADKIVADGKA